MRGDLEDERSLAEGMLGATVVVHAAASLSSGIRYGDHERTNVEGTRKVLESARRAQARRFIYISAASIVIKAGRPTHGDESLPVVHDRSMPYSATKGLAERIVLQANDSAMSTIALRPPFIWSENAPSIRHIAHAFHEGRFLWIGGGDYAYSVCHVDNLAGAVVRSVGVGQGGKAYFVTDDEVTSMRRFFTEVVEATRQAAAPHSRDRAADRQAPRAVQCAREARVGLCARGLARSWRVAHTRRSIEQDRRTRSNPRFCGRANVKAACELREPWEGTRIGVGSPVRSELLGAPSSTH